MDEHFVSEMAFTNIKNAIARNHDHRDRTLQGETLLENMLHEKAWDFNHFADSELVQSEIDQTPDVAA
jgi:hypothetical protein